MVHFSVKGLLEKYSNVKANNNKKAIINTALRDLRCDNNSLTTLDVSVNTSLKILNCSNNSLTELNVANGNNLNFTSFYATSNSGLTCIQVDSVAYSTANWANWKKWKKWILAKRLS